jgi:beta-1,4-mannosyltransferase
VTRVLMVPVQSNPYQTLLAGALRDQGIEVTLGEGPTRRPVAPLVLAWMRAGMPRVIHLHWLHRYLEPVRGRRTWAARRTLLELRVLRRLGVRVVWTLHNIGEHDGTHKSLETAFHRQVVELSDTVICHCEATRQLAIDAYDLPVSTHDRLRVVAHGNYAGWYPDTLGRDAARAALGMTAGERVFLFIGQVRGYKGVEELLSVFAAMDAPDARLIIAGRPNKKQTRLTVEAAAAVDPRVSLALGVIPDDRMQVYLRGADAVVLPYRDVLTSGSAILAMTFGQPVIAPAIGCLPESLGSEGTILYDAADPDGLEGALRTALTADLGALGERAAAHAATLAWGPIARRTAEFYEAK